MTDSVRVAADGSAPAHEARSRRALAVVVVTYHSARVLEGCLNSLARALRELDAPRVIVVDNASGDDTVAIARRSPLRPEIVQQADNGGFAAGVNAGMTAAVDCDVLVLNADTRLQPDTIGRLLAALDGPGVGIVVPRMVDESGKLSFTLHRRPTVLRALGDAILGGGRAGRIGPLGGTITGEEAYGSSGVVSWATGAAWLVSRECIDATGDLDERYFLYSEETDFMLRAADSGFALRYEPDACVVHIGGEQKTSPALWALSATNRVRFHRERRGVSAAVGMWLAVQLNESVRALLGPADDRERHRAAVKGLLGMPRWPARPSAGRPEVLDRTGFVCFAGQDWWYHNRAHSDFQLMLSLATRERVLVVNSIGMRMPSPGRSAQPVRKVLRKLRSVAKLVRRPLDAVPNFYVMSPLPLPFYGRPALRRINAVLVRAQVAFVCRLLRLTQPVIVVTIPTAWDVVAPMKRASLVFNRSDLHSEFAELDKPVIQELERSLLAHADHVLYVSRSLQARERPLVSGKSHFMDHGVDIDHFSRRADPEPADLATIPRPRVGFFGGIDEHLVDLDLLERLAVDLPNASLVLVGRASSDMNRLTRHANVHWLGYRPYEEIPSYGSGFDVAIMPRLDTEWMRQSNPIKLKEYFALGLPVVSTPFNEAIHYADHIRVAADAAEFVAFVRTIVAEGPPRSAAEQRACVEHASWDRRADELLDVLGRNAPPKTAAT